jgi:hypothetical protein
MIAFRDIADIAIFATGHYFCAAFHAITPLRHAFHFIFTLSHYYAMLAEDSAAIAYAEFSPLIIIDTLSRILIFIIAIIFAADTPIDIITPFAYCRYFSRHFLR